MRRADRLFQIIQLLRTQRVTTAARLASALEVSERTVYRDICDLTASGVPIEGERGVGYVLRKGFDLPPLMFTALEIEALVLGSRIVIANGDAALARAATDALQRIETILTEPLRQHMAQTPLFAPGWRISRQERDWFTLLRQGIDEKRKVQMAYRDASEQPTERAIRPLALSFWGMSWCVTAWCELREDFRNFRLDRVQTLELTPLRFIEEPGKTMTDFLIRFEHDAALVGM